MLDTPPDTSLSQPAWHRLDAEACAVALGADPDAGLAAAEAEARLQRSGPNLIAEGRQRGPLAMLAAQFGDFMILVLMAAALLAGLVGEAGDAVAIVLILALNAAIGFSQEYRAQRAVAALRQLAAASARVRRDGGLLQLPASELVPGDVVLLEAGNLVPADLRLLECALLRVDESTLTGESVPVDKQVEALEQAELPVSDRRNMVFKGTLVAHGRATGLVVATGMQTELGHIAALLSREDALATPLQRRLAAFGRRLAQGVLAICVLIFAAGLLRDEPPLQMFMVAVSLAVAAIPEALPAVVTIALALGARRLVRCNALVRKLSAVEALGSVTFICSDKTGTLTQNRMQVVCVEGVERRGALPPGLQGPWALLGRAMAQNNDVAVGESGALVGESTELALYRAAEAAGWARAGLDALSPRLAELPFDPVRKRMSTLHPPLPGEFDDSAVVAWVKGAPESVLPLCVADASGADFAAARWLQRAEAMAEDGLRVLVFAMRALPALPEPLSPETLERELVFLGLVGLQDPERPEAAEAVRRCREAGIVPVMITGDHPATARAIARRLGILGGEGGVLTGAELARLAPEALRERVARVRVYARVSPEQKIAIVEALQAWGELVAMTGDGVNDAPALRRADIGVAMGRNGTDVAREAAHMVLLDDNFATIVNAVREGRRIYDNLRKFVRFVLAGNLGEIWLLLAGPLLGLPLALQPIHILWVNLVTDGLPGLAFAAEPEERRVMQRPPRPPGESLFAGGLWQHVLLVGLLIGSVCLLAQQLLLPHGQAVAQTGAFLVLSLAQLLLALGNRSERESLFCRCSLGNRAMWLALAVGLGLQLAVIYLPALNPLFQTAPLTAAQFGLCAALASTVLAAVELEKCLLRRRPASDGA